MAKDFIVAIELGSSKMTGIAGRKNLDGSIARSCISVDEQKTARCMPMQAWCISRDPLCGSDGANSPFVAANSRWHQKK